MYSDCPAPNRGFTLLEVICTLIILGILGAMTFSGFGSALTGYALMRESGTTTMQAELALIRLQKELSAATFNIKKGETGNTISFLRTDETPVTISLSENALLLSCNDAEAAVLLDGVGRQEGRPFIDVNTRTMLITLSFQLNTESGTTPFSLSVSPRNTPPAKS